MFHSYTDIFVGRAQSYHAAMLALPHARDAEFEGVLEPLNDAGEGLVCDMPAGGGYLANYVGKTLSYVGVEPVEAFAASAVGRAAGSTLNAPLTAVPLPTGSVDYVVSLAGLHHEPDVRAVFAEMSRLLRFGGRAVIADVAVGTGPARFLNGFVDRNNPQGHDGRFLDATTTRLLEKAGLAVIEDREIDVPWLFQSSLEAGAFCERLFGITGATSERIAEAMEEDIGFESDNGRVRLKWTLRRIVLEAK